MYTTIKDLSFLSELISEFFQQKHVQKQLNKIDELGISGWEVWLQVELYIFFKEKKEHKVLNEVIREYRYELDQRSQYVKKTGRKECAIDFEIMKRNAKSESKWIPIELKQSVKAHTCISNILNDLDKYYSIKPSEKIRGNFREPFFLGVFKSISEDSEKNRNEISALMDYFELTKHHKIIEIPSTHFTSIIF